MSGPIFEGAHFVWGEVVCKCGRDDCPRLPENLDAVVNATRMLEKIRTILGDRPIRVSSWYRCPFRNRQVGGAANSQHLHGRAIDFGLKALSPRQVQARLRPYFGEGGKRFVRGLGSYVGFTHTDNRPGEPATWRG